MLCVQSSNLRVQPSRPRSDEVRSVVRDAFRVGHEGFSLASDGLTLALAVADPHTPRLPAVRFGVFRLRAEVDRLHAKVAGLRTETRVIVHFRASSAGLNRCGARAPAPGSRERQPCQLGMPPASTSKFSCAPCAMSSAGRRPRQ